jgi:thiol-disulfide isomerase/thioredoxin
MLAQSIHFTFAPEDADKAAAILRELRDAADGTGYAKKFVNRYSHRIFSGIGHNVRLKKPRRPSPRRSSTSIATDSRPIRVLTAVPAGSSTEMIFGMKSAAALLALATVAFPIGATSLNRPGSVPSAQSGVTDRFTWEKSPWFNSSPLSGVSLRGKVILVNFWTYSCINSLRPLPYVKTWAAKYKTAGLVVIGVHTPEFAFEKEPANVGEAVRNLQVSYPVVMDSDYGIWNAFDNQYWPAFYLIDGNGRVRYRHFGEGAYSETERVIQKLLMEHGANGLSAGTVSVFGAGIEAAPSNDEQSPETYIGYRRAEQFASPKRVARNTAKIYSPPARLSLNHWALSGPWNVGAESAVLQTAPGKLAFRFHSRDLHLVLGPTTNGEPVRFKVTLDGVAPSDDHGADSAPDGTGQVREPRLYQLIRQRGPIGDRTCEVEFLDPGVHAYAFTFG